MINKVILIGRLGQDPEVKHTPSGTAVANLSLATSEKWTDKQGERQEKTEWHRIVLWNKLAELAGEYLSKGRLIYLEGKLQTRQWDDRDGNKRYTTEVVGYKMTFLGGKADGEKGGQHDGGHGTDGARGNGNGDYGQPPMTDDVRW